MNKSTKPEITSFKQKTEILFFFGTNCSPTEVKNKHFCVFLLRSIKMKPAHRDTKRSFTANTVVPGSWLWQHWGQNWWVISVGSKMQHAAKVGQAKLAVRQPTFYHQMATKQVQLCSLVNVVVFHMLNVIETKHAYLSVEWRATASWRSVSACRSGLGVC